MPNSDEYLVHTTNNSFVGKPDEAVVEHVATGKTWHAYGDTIEEAITTAHAKREADQSQPEV